ncbi:copper uptake transcriptional regulator YcnK [Virgibacillus kimchii]
MLGDVLFCYIFTYVRDGSDFMFPVERQNRIRELIADRHTMKISDLSKILGVSDMTIHRDIKPLIDEGYITKTFGGISLKKAPGFPDFSEGDCIVCQKAVNEKLAYRIILPGAKIETACCIHCGFIRHHQLREEPVQAICRDFLIQTTVDATVSFYVMDTSICMGCCQPQVLSFHLKEHAEKFVRGFGGDVYTFEEAMEKNVKKTAGKEC